MCVVHSIDSVELIDSDLNHRTFNTPNMTEMKISKQMKSKQSRKLQIYICVMCILDSSLRFDSIDGFNVVVVVVFVTVVIACMCINL